MTRKKNFEDDFEELTYYLRIIFNQKQSLINSSVLQRRAQSVLKVDRYNIITHNNKPRYVCLDARILDKIRNIMVNMGYIRDKALYVEALPDPHKLPEPKPDKLTFHIEEED